MVLIASDLYSTKTGTQLVKVWGSTTSLVGA